MSVFLAVKLIEQSRMKHINNIQHVTNQNTFIKTFNNYLNDYFKFVKHVKHE